MIKKKKTKINFIFLILITIISMFPIAVMVSFSFRSRATVFSSIFFPVSPTIENYMSIFKNKLLMKYLFNSFSLATFVTLLSITLGTTTGYGLSRYKFKGQKALLILLFSTQMAPPVFIATGLFKLIIRLGLYNNLLSLILINTAGTLPFAIWMMKGYFDGIPKSIDEAAMIDGCSCWKAYLKIIIPVSTPGILAIGIYSFLMGWSEYLYATIFMVGNDKNMVTTGIVHLLGRFIIQWGLVMAYAIIISAPILILFVVLQRYFVSGLTGGAVKG